MMHEAYRPVALTVALWPTQDFQFPAEASQFGDRMREQFAFLNEQRINAALGDPVQLEWPQLILMGDQRHWTLEMAPGKITLRWAINRTGPLAELFDQHRNTLAPIHAWLSETFNFRVYRLGLVMQIFCNTRSSANEKIAQYFLHPRALQGQTPYDVQLGILSKLSLEPGVFVNRWLRVRPLRTIDPRRVDFAAQIEVDLNTMPEDTQVRTARDLADFYDSACHYLENDLPLLCDSEFVD